MMKSIALEVAPYRIRVNSIAPGAIRAPINMQTWDTPEHYNELLKLIPYKRIGELEEISGTIFCVAVGLIFQYRSASFGFTSSR